MQEFTRLVLVCIISQGCFIFSGLQIQGAILFMVPGVLGLVIMMYILVTTKTKTYYVIKYQDDP